MGVRMAEPGETSRPVDCAQQGVWSQGNRVDGPGGRFDVWSGSPVRQPADAAGPVTVSQGNNRPQALLGTSGVDTGGEPTFTWGPFQSVAPGGRDSVRDRTRVKGLFGVASVDPTCVGVPVSTSGG